MEKNQDPKSFLMLTWYSTWRNICKGLPGEIPVKAPGRLLQACGALLQWAWEVPGSWVSLAQPDRANVAPNTQPQPLPDGLVPVIRWLSISPQDRGKPQEKRERLI